MPRPIRRSIATHRRPGAGPTSAVTDLPKEIAAQAWAETRSPTAEPALVELQLRALTAAARYRNTYNEQSD